MKFITIICLLCSLSMAGQNLENLGGKPFEVSGNISVGGSFYEAIDQENRRSPYSYFISANPVFKIYGFSIPVSLVYRDQEGSISNPFNRYSINPTWKWISLHAGNTSIQLNPYTLSGQQIKGGGIELTPWKFRFTVLAGELENPISQIDTIVKGAEILKSYTRNAQGAKIGYGSSKNFVELTAFRAKDDINSVNIEDINERLIQPEENIVAGISFKVSPVKWVSLQANAGASAHTSNQETFNLLESEELNKLAEEYNNIFTLNFSSKLQFAGDAGLDFKFKNFGFGGEYKRVDPFYTSLGTYYFQEDYENILVKLNFNLFKNKIRFNGRGGIQRNNLNGLRAVTNTRQIANGSITVIPNRSFSAVLRYSNFQTEKSPGLVEVNDTLRYARTTAVYGFLPRYSFGKKELKSTISAGINYQNLEDLLNNEKTDRAIENYNANLTYGLRIQKIQGNASVSLLANQNIIAGRITQRIGGNLRFSKKLLAKKLSLSAGVGFMQNTVDRAYDGQSITGRIGVKYTLKRKYTASLNTNYLNRIGPGNSNQEIRGSLKFTYIFSAGKSEKTKRS